MRIALMIVSALLVVFGLLFFFQGIGAVGGSGMTGDRTWAVIGPVLAAIGLVLGIWTLRRGPRSS